MVRQPGYLPNLGFFKKIETSDYFVYLDDAQFSKDLFENRNKIRTFSGIRWLTVPLLRPVFKKKLNEVKIANSTEWNVKHKNIIKENYQNAPYFSQYWDPIEQILSKKWEKLIDLNLELIQYFNLVLGLSTKTIKSSKLTISSTKSSRLLEICKKLNATTYISGESGKNYLDESIFQASEIKVLYERFQHPTYHQLHGGFIPNMSIIDLLFNEGDNSKQILRNSKNL